MICYVNYIVPKVADKFLDNLKFYYTLIKVWCQIVNVLFDFCSVPSTPQGRSSRLSQLMASTPGSGSSTGSKRSPKHVLKSFKGKDGREQMILVSLSFILSLSTFE